MLLCSHYLQFDLAPVSPSMIQVVLIFNTHGKLSYSQRASNLRCDAKLQRTGTRFTGHSHIPPSSACTTVSLFPREGRPYQRRVCPSHSRLGKPRLSKFYTPLSPLVQQTLIAQIFSLISDRPSGLCNFLDAPDLVFPSPNAGSDGKGKERRNEVIKSPEDDTRVIYRHYATLYFV